MVESCKCDEFNSLAFELMIDDKIFWHTQKVFEREERIQSTGLLQSARINA